jgi:hypothetical protein
VRRLLALAVAVVPVAAALGAGCDSGGREPEPAPRPSPAITPQELGEHLDALQRIADRNGGTRAAGTPGYDASADYVADRLRDAGWNVTRQAVQFTYFELRRASLSVGGRSLTRVRQFQVLSYSGSGRARGTLRASGDGCEPEDFERLQDNQIPLVDRSECFFREKAANAERAGAGALVVAEAVRSRRGVPSGTLAVPGIGIPVVLASVRALGEAGDGSPASVSVDVSSRGARADNVIAETPGGSADRIVMAGGHLDSVAGGPGINDNGSGAATLIEATEAIGTKPPGARVRVAFWTAEEVGLHGSRTYVRSLDRAERRRIRAYINLDMVGSPNAVPEVYEDGAPALGGALRRAYGGRLGGILAGQSSDHAPFQSAGIAINGLYTGSDERGPGGRPRDPCYHLDCDTVRNVDRRVLLRMARTAARALRILSARHK